MYSIWKTLSLNEEVPSGAESQATDASSFQEDHLDHWRHIKTRWKPPQLQRRHVRNTHYWASRTQCFASTSRNTTKLHTISSTTQKPTLAKANACQIARVQQTVLLKLPSHRKPVATQNNTHAACKSHQRRWSLWVQTCRTVLPGISQYSHCVFSGYNSAG